LSCFEKKKEKEAGASFSGCVRKNAGQDSGLLHLDLVVDRLHAIHALGDIAGVVGLKGVIHFAVQGDLAVGIAGLEVELADKVTLL